MAALKAAMGVRDLSRRKRDFEGNPVTGGESSLETTAPAPTTCVSWQHFETAFKKLKPSVSKKDRVLYEEIRSKAMDLQ